MSAENPFVGGSNDTISTSVQPGDTITISIGQLPLAFKPPCRVSLVAQNGVFYIDTVMEQWTPDDSTGYGEAVLFIIDVADVGEATATEYSSWDATREPWGVLAMRIAISTTTADLAVGTVTHTIQANKALSIQGKAEIYPLDAPQMRARAEIIDYSGTSLVLKIAALTDIFNASPITVASVDAIDAAGTGYNRGETITLTGGTFASPCILNVDDIDDTTGAILAVSINDPGSFTVFPSDPVSQGSTSGSGTGFQCDLTSSVTFDRWLIEMIDETPAGIPFLARNGLQVSLSGTTLTVTKGSIRDSTNTYDLVLPSTFTKDLSATWAAGSGNGGMQFSSNLSGTVSVTGTTMTGSGTTFLSDVANAGVVSFPDFVARGGSLGIAASLTAIKISGAAETFATSTTGTAGSVTNTTSVSGATYQRGGYYTGAITTASSFNAPVGVALIRNDTTGVIDVSTFALSGGGTADLPSGYSIFGAIAVVFPIYFSGTYTQTQIAQWSGVALAQISPMTTRGDMITQGATGPQRLALGASGALVQSNGTDLIESTALANGVTATTQSANDNSTKVATTAYVDSKPAGSLTLLNTLTANNSAGTLADTTSITSAYDSYDIEIETLVLASNTQLRLQFTEDGGSTWKTASYVNKSLADGSAVTTVTSAIDICGATNLGTSTAQTYNATLRLFNPNQTTGDKTIIGQAAGASGPTTFAISGRYTGDQAAINGIRLITGTAAGTAVGNLVSGKMRIYGRKTS